VCIIIIITTTQRHHHHHHHHHHHLSAGHLSGMPLDDAAFVGYDYNEAHWHHYGSTGSHMDYVQQPRPKQYWARGCRGGAKRNKWKKEAARILAEKGVHVECSSTSSGPSGNEDSKQPAAADDE